MPTRLLCFPTALSQKPGRAEQSPEGPSFPDQPTYEPVASSCESKHQVPKATDAPSSLMEAFIPPPTSLAFPFFPTVPHSPPPTLTLLIPLPAPAPDSATRTLSRSRLWAARRFRRSASTVALLDFWASLRRAFCRDFLLVVPPPPLPLGLELEAVAWEDVEGGG